MLASAGRFQGVAAAAPRPSRVLRASASPVTVLARSPLVGSSGQSLVRSAPRPWGARSPKWEAAVRLAPVSAAQRAAAMELLLDAVPGGKELLSPRLDPEVRQRAEKAISQRGGRVTIGDVASTAGLRLDQAEAAVRALAADSQATLQVADDGEIVWVFKRGFEAAIRSKSLLLRLEPTAQAIKSGGEYLLRVAFGSALIVSVLAVFAAITVLASSRDDNNNNRRQGSGYGMAGGGARMFFNLSDILWYWDPFYYRNRRVRMQQQGPEGMNFLEAIFSWVFGDGDPNADYDKQRWQSVGRYIQARGGTVVAEELAPFLDLKPGQLGKDRDQRITVDESYMLPVLARFNGTPTVDARGNIVYTFSDLQQTATAGGRRAPPPRKAFLENKWVMTAASAGQKLAAIALGAVNLLGVVALTSMLAEPYNQMALAQNGLLWVVGAMPFLQVYAASFFAIPALRSLQNTARNAAIEARNQARQEALGLLAAPDATLMSKLAGAEQQAQRRVITERDVVYRSDRAVEEQPVDAEASDFENRLRLRERERLQQERPGRVAQQKRQEEPVQDDDAPPLWWQQQQQRQREKDRR